MNSIMTYGIESNLHIFNAATTFNPQANMKPPLNAINDARSSEVSLKRQKLEKHKNYILMCRSRSPAKLKNLLKTSFEEKSSMFSSMSLIIDLKWIVSLNKK